MDAIEYIMLQYADVDRFFGAVLQGLTSEQLNWATPGMTNPIGSTLLHTFGGEDMFFQQILQGKPTLWESQGWGVKIGVAHPPGGGSGWEEARSTQLPLAVVLEYIQTVQATTRDYLAGLTAAELERKITLFGREARVVDVVVLQVTHIAEHGGEIAAIKGLQGTKGLPF